MALAPPLKLVTGAAPLPDGERVLVTEYGKNQLDAIDRCTTIVPFKPVPADPTAPKDAPLPTENLRIPLRNGDILVAVRATEIVWTDTVMATGQYQHQAKLPYTPGMTFSGTVAGLTPEAEAAGLRLNQRVAVAGIDAGPRSLGGYQSQGGCSTYAVAPLSAVRQVPDSWSFAHAACFAYGYDTAYHCLVERGKVRKGEVVLIHGATGGVGIPAVAIAKMLGATVIATTRSETKTEFLKSIGVDHVVCFGEREGGQQPKRWSKEVKALTAKGRGVDVVYDGVGGDAVTVESLHALRFSGRLLIVGWAATPNVAQAGGKRQVNVNPNRIPTNLIMMKQITVTGCPAMIAARYDRTLVPRRTKALTEWILAGKLPPPIIAKEFNGMAQYKEAMKSRVASGSGVGSTVLLLPAVVGTAKL